MYKAIKHLDFYYLVEDSTGMYPDFIELTEERYRELLKIHQETGNMLRVCNGEVVVCSEDRPSSCYDWDSNTGEWVVDPVKEKEHNLGILKSRLDALKNEMIIAHIRNHDITSLLSEIEQVEGEINELKK